MELAKSVLFHSHESPLEIVEHAVPKPGDSEILVRITCCTLCRSDLYTHSGRRLEAVPTILGHEIVGVIEKFGSARLPFDSRGTPASVGTRITWAIAAGCGQCFFCQNDLPQKCKHPLKYGHHRTTREQPNGGGLADYIRLSPETVWYVVPDGISEPVAAMANCAFATAAALVRTAGDVRNKSILILGAGALGVAVSSMASTLGARQIISCDTDFGNCERAIRFGATHSLSCKGSELDQQLMAITGGYGVDIALELAGVIGTVEAAIRNVRIGGTVILAGTVAPTPPLALLPEQIVRRMLTIRGVHNYHPNDLAVALDFLSNAGQHFPFADLIETHYPLDKIEDAFGHAHRSSGRRIAVTTQDVTPSHGKPS